jgi:hypothetical protein
LLVCYLVGFLDNKPVTAAPVDSSQKGQQIDVANSTLVDVRNNVINSENEMDTYTEGIDDDDKGGEEGDEYISRNKDQEGGNEKGSERSANEYLETSSVPYKDKDSIKSQDNSTSNEEDQEEESNRFFDDKQKEKEIKNIYISESDIGRPNVDKINNEHSSEEAYHAYDGNLSSETNSGNAPLVRSSSSKNGHDAILESGRGVHSDSSELNPLQLSGSETADDIESHKSGEFREAPDSEFLTDTYDNRELPLSENQMASSKEGDANDGGAVPNSNDRNESDSIEPSDGEESGILHESHEELSTTHELHKDYVVDTNASHDTEENSGELHDPEEDTHASHDLKEDPDAAYDHETDVSVSHSTEKGIGEPHDPHQEDTHTSLDLKEDPATANEHEVDTNVSHDTEEDVDESHDTKEDTGESHDPEEDAHISHDFKEDSDAAHDDESKGQDSKHNEEESAERDETVHKDLALNVSHDNYDDDNTDVDSVRPAKGDNLEVSEGAENSSGGMLTGKKDDDDDDDNGDTDTPDEPVLQNEELSEKESDGTGDQNLSVEGSGDLEQSTPKSDTENKIEHVQPGARSFGQLSVVPSDDIIASTDKETRVPETAEISHTHDDIEDKVKTIATSVDTLESHNKKEDSDSERTDDSNVTESVTSSENNTLVFGPHLQKDKIRDQDNDFSINEPGFGSQSQDPEEVKGSVGSYVVLAVIMVVIVVLLGYSVYKSRHRNAQEAKNEDLETEMADVKKTLLPGNEFNGSVYPKAHPEADESNVKLLGEKHFRGGNAENEETHKVEPGINENGVQNQKELKENHDSHNKQGNDFGKIESQLEPLDVSNNPFKSQSQDSSNPLPEAVFPKENGASVAQNAHDQSVKNPFRQNLYNSVNENSDGLSAVHGRSQERLSTPSSPASCVKVVAIVNEDSIVKMPVFINRESNCVTY